MADNNGVETFGDGSNNWLGGVQDFASDPGQAVRNPYRTVAGAADAATLNFDEGVGGLTSLADGEAGNTAGPGQSPLIEPSRDGQPPNPGSTGSSLLDAVGKAGKFLIAFGLIYVVGQLLTFRFDVGDEGA